MSRLAGKVAVVTGASKGIGAAIAEAYAKEGAKVIVNYARGEQQANAVVERIKKAGGTAAAVKADLSSGAEIEELFKQTDKIYGPVDILVNNAGLYDFRPLSEFDQEHYHKHFDLNVYGLLGATKEAVDRFGDRGGVVINISSVVGKTPGAGSVVYNATKGAVDNITKTLALELAPKVRVVALSPGFTITEGVGEKVPAEMQEGIAAKTPLGRPGQPDDIAKVAVFLGSDEAAWITGEIVTASGGLRL